VKDSELIDSTQRKADDDDVDKEGEPKGIGNIGYLAL
jgi:hypothetical protein